MSIYACIPVGRVLSMNEHDCAYIAGDEAMIGQVLAQRHQVQLFHRFVSSHLSLVYP
jgi:hypothetical protein